MVAAQGAQGPLTRRHASEASPKAQGVIHYNLLRAPLAGLPHSSFQNLASSCSSPQLRLLTQVRADSRARRKFWTSLLVTEVFCIGLSSGSGRATLLDLTPAVPFHSLSALLRELVFRPIPIHRLLPLQAVLRQHLNSPSRLALARPPRQNRFAVTRVRSFLPRLLRLGDSTTSLRPPKPRHEPRCPDSRDDLCQRIRSFTLPFDSLARTRSLPLPTSLKSETDISTLLLFGPVLCWHLFGKALANSWTGKTFDALTGTPCSIRGLG